MSLNTLTYPYMPKLRTMALGIVVFAFFTFSAALSARSNQRGLVFNGMLHLNVHSATIFYWFASALSGVGLLVAIRGFYVGSAAPHRIMLTATAITAPRSAISLQPTSVTLAYIRHLRIVETKNNLRLQIHHAAGTLTIQEVALPDRKTFKALCQALAERMPDKTPA